MEGRCPPPWPTGRPAGPSRAGSGSRTLELDREQRPETGRAGCRKGGRSSGLGLGPVARRPPAHRLGIARRMEAGAAALRLERRRPGRHRPSTAALMRRIRQRRPGFGLRLGLRQGRLARRRATLRSASERVGVRQLRCAPCGFAAPASRPAAHVEAAAGGRRGRRARSSRDVARTSAMRASLAASSSGRWFSTVTGTLPSWAKRWRPRAWSGRCCGTDPAPRPDTWPAGQAEGRGAC